MTREEIARLGGKTLAAKVSPSYFAFIGRRGGRRTKRNEILAFAASLEENEPERAAIWFEKAQKYHDETGTLVMLDLWASGNCEALPGRRVANTDAAKWRRWEREVRAWAA
jgi:hypothetical protein